MSHDKVIDDLIKYLYANPVSSIKQFIKREYVDKGFIEAKDWNTFTIRVKEKRKEFGKPCLVF